MGRSAKKRKTHTPEENLKKLKSINAKLQEWMDGVEHSEVDADKPLSFSQKRKLSAALERAPVETLLKVQQLLPERMEPEGKSELVMDEMENDTLKRLWSLAISLQEQPPEADPLSQAPPTQADPTDPVKSLDVKPTASPNDVTAEAEERHTQFESQREAAETAEVVRQRKAEAQEESAVTVTSEKQSDSGREQPLVEGAETICEAAGADLTEEIKKTPTESLMHSASL